MNLDTLLDQLESEPDIPYLKTLEAIFPMTDREQYQFWCHVLERHSPLVVMFTAVAGIEQVKYIISEIYHHGDESLFARALRKTHITIMSLEFSPELNSIIVACSKEMPETIEHLFKKAEFEKRYSYLLVVGSNKNKKDLLRSILKSGSREIIDKFFTIYKDHPEVKHLTVFL